MPSLTGGAHAGQAERYGAESQTEHYAQEYGRKIGLVERLYGVGPKKSFHVVYVLRCANNCYAVAILQPYVVGGQQPLCRLSVCG